MIGRRMPHHKNWHSCLCWLDLQSYTWHSLLQYFALQHLLHIFILDTLSTLISPSTQANAWVGFVGVTVAGGDDNVVSGVPAPQAASQAGLALFVCASLLSLPSTKPTMDRLRNDVTIPGSTTGSASPSRSYSNPQGLRIRTAAFALVALYAHFPHNGFQQWLVFSPLSSAEST